MPTAQQSARINDRPFDGLWKIIRLQGADTIDCGLATGVLIEFRPNGSGNIKSGSFDVEIEWAINGDERHSSAHWKIWGRRAIEGTGTARLASSTVIHGNLSITGRVSWEYSAIKS